LRDRDGRVGAGAAVAAVAPRAMRLGVDVGGTFTDLVALHDDGRIEVRKVATTPEDPAVGLFRAVDDWGKGEEGRGMRAAETILVYGTTVATNALLERRCARRSPTSPSPRAVKSCRCSASTSAPVPRPPRPTCGRRFRRLSRAPRRKPGAAASRRCAS